MTAAELLRTALEKEHEKRLTLCPDGERFDLARVCVAERDAFERFIGEVEEDWSPGPRAAFEAAVFALAGVDP